MPEETPSPSSKTTGSKASDSNASKAESERWIALINEAMDKGRTNAAESAVSREIGRVLKD